MESPPKKRVNKEGAEGDEILPEYENQEARDFPQTPRRSHDSPLEISPHELTPTKGIYESGYITLGSFITANPDLPIKESIDFLNTKREQTAIEKMSVFDIVEAYRHDTNPGDAEISLDTLEQYYIGGYQLVKYTASFHEIVEKERLNYLNLFISTSIKSGISRVDVNSLVEKVIRETAICCKILQFTLTNWGVRLEEEKSVYTGFAFEIPRIKSYVKDCLSDVMNCVEGDIITFPFCISTSANKEIATKLFTSSPEQIVLKINLPIGCPYTFISTEGIEAELLLPFGCRLLFVQKIDEDDRKIYVFNLVGYMDFTDFEQMIDNNTESILAKYKIRIMERGGKKTRNRRHKKTRNRRHKKTKK